MDHMCGICQAGLNCVCHLVPRDMLANANRAQAKQIGYYKDEIKKLSDRCARQEKHILSLIEQRDFAVSEQIKLTEELQNLKRDPLCPVKQGQVYYLPANGFKVLEDRIEYLENRLKSFGMF